MVGEKKSEWSECEHTPEKREIKGIQFQSLNIHRLIIYLILHVSRVSQENDKLYGMLCIRYFITELLQNKNGKLYKVSQWEHASRWCCIAFYSRDTKKCSTRQTITLIDGCTAVNYVTNNVFSKKTPSLDLKIDWIQKFSVETERKAPIDLLMKPEPGDDFKIRENHKLMFRRPHGDYY